MMTAFQVVIGILLLQMYAHGKENATKETVELKVLNTTLADTTDKNNTHAQVDISKSKETISVNKHQEDQGQRQKRGYNFNGFQPFSPIYPSYALGNDPSNNGAYGQEDPLVQIHKRLSEIVAILRQPTMPPTTSYPIILPPLYLPSSNCKCTPSTNKRPSQLNPTQTKPIQPKPTQPIRPTTNIPQDVPPRELEVSNSVNESFIEHDEDFSRPIAFEPIIPIEGIKRKPPPVEHGSVQGEIIFNNSVVSNTTSPPPINGNAYRSIPTLPSLYLPTPNLPTQDLPTQDLPTDCDKAILTCCAQVTISYNCFATNGCPDPSLFGNPCDAAVIQTVIERLRVFFEKRNSKL